MSCPPHPAEEVSIRRKVAMAGDKFVHQCGRCGAQVGGPIKPERLVATGVHPGKVERWDVRKTHKPRPNSRKKAYQAFHKTARFRALKKRRFSYANYTCEGENCDMPAEELHIENVPEGDLEKVGFRDVRAACGGIGGCNMAQRNASVAARAFGDDITGP